MAQDPRPLLISAIKTLGDAPDVNTLRSVREALDAPLFFSEIDDFLRGKNHPNTREEILRYIVNIQRHCADKTAERKNELTNTRYGIGLGAGLVTAGLIGLAAATPVLFVVVFAGGWIAGASVKKTEQLSAEEQAYQDIANQASAIREKLSAG